MIIVEFLVIAFVILISVAFGYYLGAIRNRNE